MPRNRAIGLLKVGRLAEGHAALAGAEAVLIAGGDAHGAAVFKMQRAKAAFDLGRPAEAIGLYREIDPSVLGDGERATYHEQLAEAYYAAGQQGAGPGRVRPFPSRLPAGSACRGHRRNIPGLCRASQGIG